MSQVEIMLAILFFLFPGPAWADDDPMKGPWDSLGAAAFQPKKKKDQANAGIALVSFYKKYISPIDGTNCPMYPSDSRYAVECFRKHGFAMGWIMTVDRLYRCGRDELKLSPSVMVNGQQKCFDTVANNDFWWRDAKE